MSIDVAERQSAAPRQLQPGPMIAFAYRAARAADQGAVKHTAKEGVPA
jgi:hypothetical protein